MARLKTVHRCTACGATASQWQGRCPGCGEWNTLVEQSAAPPAAAVPRLRPAERAQPIGRVDATGAVSVPTGVGELDRVLGGGLVPGSMTLLGGEPGIGKSTLVLQALASRAAKGERCLLISAEESAQQVRARAERLGAVHPDLWLLSTTSIPEILAAVGEVGPAVLAVDSVQTVVDPEVGATPGTVTQVRGAATTLTQVAKDLSVATILVGHVTKDGALAGPRTLEHVVDTVLSFEGDRHHALRLLRAVKHRFGATGELGLFEMSERGMVGLPDPSRLFLGDRRPGVAGSVVVPVLEGARVLLVEVQALTTVSTMAYPRRTAQGLDGNRLELLLAVLAKHCDVKAAADEVFASAVGGVKVVEPAADLGVALAIASAKLDVPIPADVIACGEVGLGGELRQVAQTQRRLAEAARLGFKRAVVPLSAPQPPPGIATIRAGDLRHAITDLGLFGSRPGVRR